MEAFLISIANNIIGGKGWLYVLKAIFFLLAGGGTLLQKNRAAFFSYFASGIVILFAVRASVFTLFLYWFWSQAVPSKYLLPPYQPLSYFAQYSFTHFYFSFLLALMTTGAISLVFLFLKKHRNNTFQPGDIALYASCCMIIRWPLLLPYTLVVFASAALFLIVTRYIIKDSRTVFLYPYFLYSAIPFIFFDTMLIQICHLQSLVLPL